jgi:hypothetical protein
LFGAPERVITTPIWTTISPKEEVDGKMFARKTFEFIDHETHIFARNQKAVHPTRKMNHVKSGGDTANGSL